MRPHASSNKQSGTASATSSKPPSRISRESSETPGAYGGKKGGSLGGAGDEGGGTGGGGGGLLMIFRSTQLAITSAADPEFQSHRSAARARVELSTVLLAKLHVRMRR